MAVCLLTYKVSDLCLGKPPVRSLSAASATIADAIAALKSSPEQTAVIGVWTSNTKCVGKVSMVDILCFLCKHHNLVSPSSALNSPILSAVSPRRVRHVERSSSLLEAIDLIVYEDVQSLVVPITTKKSTAGGGGQEFCWLTQEDIIRFLLSSIAFFSPISTLSIDVLGIVSGQFPIINYGATASSAMAAVSRCLADQTSVAVVDDEGRLIGEISPSKLAFCDETVAAAAATLSAGELMTYIDCVGASAARMEMIACRPGSSMVAVMIQAIAHRVNYIWVIGGGAGAVVGIVTYANILKVFHRKLESMI
ncbi:CBS domain-containing protein CBSX5-like [Andrographis paniculata]|uniref:CBS domain-containing protein CBSX5-like n=1 Tax=Andrographis paniculata TaxID=175694 RepID=UPI0021E8FF86|nr:CBS domain-containing protein CBSX5-like [Andrographis paniculata]